MNSNPALPISDAAVLPWPRRTSKACASCRRDKIRCDGSRPCGGCRKKGYPAEQCTEGCEACRRARVRCEEGKPCPRCGELGLECSESPGSAMHAPLASAPSAGARYTAAASASSKSATSRAGDRAKLACSNCRRDNKKCDDQRPCSRCVARSEECVHLPRGPKLIKLRCDECRTHNKRCEETRPCQYCIDLGNQCVTATRKGRGHGTRVKAACVACRRDKIRCNGDRPCAACTKKGCECIERACQLCVDEGRGSECTHRKPVDTGSADAAEGSTSQFARLGNEQVPPPGTFHAFRDVPLAVNGHVLPHWESRAPVPHSHPLHSMYPTVIPQEQYYFPPHPAQHSTVPAFLMSTNMVPSQGAGSQHNHYYAPESDIERSHFFGNVSAPNGSGSFFNSPRGPG